MREQLMDKIGDGLNNPLTLDWTTFTWQRGYLLHTVTASQIERPYLIAELYYDDSDYEYIILLLNRIANPFDMRPGMEIRIPIFEDVNDFILENKK